MGADSFVAFYGIKIPLDPDDEETLDACGSGTDPRCRAAAAAGLDAHSGRMTDGEDYYLLVGRRLGWLGLEGDGYVQVSDAQWSAVRDLVERGLQQAGFSGSAALHLQLEAQY